MKCKLDVSGNSELKLLLTQVHTLLKHNFLNLSHVINFSSTAPQLGGIMQHAFDSL